MVGKMYSDVNYSRIQNPYRLYKRVTFLLEMSRRYLLFMHRIYICTFFRATGVPKIDIWLETVNAPFR